MPASGSSARGMNDARASSVPARRGPRGSAAGCPIARVRQRWLTLTGGLIAALLVPWLVVGWHGGIGWLALAGGAGLLLLGCAKLSFERLIAPELRAIERARAELDTRHAAALRSASETSEYLRDVSHEIRATMHAVLGLTQLLSRSPLDSTQHRQMRTIDGAARALLRIINDLMALSGTGRRSLEVVPMGGSLHDVLRVSADLLEPAAKNRGLELELELALDLPDRVLLDTGRVQQLLLGTCRYAIEGCAQGKLRIVARPLDMNDANFMLSLHVEPQLGTGPASTTGATERVAGLGRIIELVSAMGGSLALGDGGGMLELRLPVQRIDGSEAPRLRPPSEATGRGLIRLPGANAPLLVVDSDEASRVAAIELLENLGFEVESVSSAPHAIERVAQARFALILLDTELAGLDGYMAAARILTQLGHGRPPIIGLCRGPLAEARERAAKAGMDALLAKPIGRDALCAALAEWLPDDSHPTSSGMRLSQAGALARATERAEAAKRSQPPVQSIPELSSGAGTSSLEQFVREAPVQYRSLARAVARGQRDEAARLAAALAERCAECGAARMAALCRTLERARELPVDQLSAAVEALGRALDGVLGKLGALGTVDSPPASASSDRNPDGP